MPDVAWDDFEPVTKGDKPAAVDWKDFEPVTTKPESPDAGGFTPKQRRAQFNTVAKYGAGESGLGDLPAPGTAKLAAASVPVALSQAGAAARGALADVGTGEFKFPNTRAGFQGQPLPIDATMQSIKSPGISIPYKVAGTAIESAPKMAAVMASGPAAPATAGYLFGYDEEGNFHPDQAVINAALPFVSKFGGAITQNVAERLGATKAAALNLSNAAGRYGTANAVLAAQALPDWNKLNDEQKIDTVAGILSNAAIGLADFHGVKRIPGIPKSADILPRAKAAAIETLNEKPASEVTPKEAATAVPPENAPGGTTEVKEVPKTPETASIPLTKDSTPEMTGLDPEHHQLLMDEVERGGHNVEVVTNPIPDNEPFARQMATIDRKTGKILINPKQVNRWLNSKGLGGVPEGKKAQAIRSLLSEEQIHLATKDADALKYHDSLTGAEKAIGQRVYGGRKGATLNPTMLGHELLRQRMQKLARTGVRETIEASRKERWTVKSLLALSDVIRSTREALGTKASKEGVSILDKVKSNLDAAIADRMGETPGATGKGERDDVKEIEGMSGPDFAADMKKRGSLTIGAWDIGKSVKSPEELSQLQAAMERSKSAGRAAMAQGKLNEASTHLNKGQFFREAYEAATGTGSAGKALREREASYKPPFPEGKVEETPAARRKGEENTPGFYLPPTEEAGARPTASEMGALPEQKIPPEQALQTDTVHWNKPNAWRRVTNELLTKPYSLGKQLTEGSRTGEGEPVSTTKRLVALEKNGKVDVVSIYPDADDGARLVDPVKSGKTKRPNVSIKTLLDEGYKPIVSMLRTEGVQNFHRHFDSREQFEQTVGKPGDDMWANFRGYEAQTAATQASSFGKGTEMTDSEAMALHDHLIEHESVDAAADAIAGSPNKQQLRSALGKAINQIMASDPELTREQAAGKAFEELHENAKSATNRKSFVTRTLGDFGKESPESVRELAARETPSQFEQIAATEQGGDSGINPEGRTIPVNAPEIEDGQGDYDPDLSLLRGESEPAAVAKFASDQIKLTEDDIKDAMTKKVTSGVITRAFGNAQNLPNILAQREETGIRLASAEKPKGTAKALSQQWRRGNKDVLAAANAVVQAQGVRPNGTIDNGRKTQLHTFMAQVAAGNAEAQKWITSGDRRQASMGRKWLRSNAELMKELQYADAHWNDPDLQKTAVRMKQSLDEQWDREKRSGIEVQKDPNYDPQRYDAAVWNEHSILFNAVNGTEKIMGGRFRKPKTFPTYYAAAQAGPYIPVTRDGASLVSHRVRQGMSLIERNAWSDGLKGMMTPSGEAVAHEPKIVNGQIAPPASRNYDNVKVGNKIMAVHEDFQKLISQLAGESKLEDLPLAPQAMRASMMIKHAAIVGDIFHLMKTGYFAASILRSKFGPTSWRKGWNALDLKPQDVSEAVRKGVISQKDADWASGQVKYGGQNISRRDLALKFVKEGANLGKIQDALYKDLVTHVSPGAGGIGKAWSRVTDPSIGRWNRFLFDQFTRGLMTQANVESFERQSKANPDLNPDALVRDIARDVNNRFGNIGKQGWVKSSTWQDVQRMLWFAPNWEAGIIKSELAGYSRLSGLSKLTGQRKGVTPFGVAGASMATGLATLMALSQAANLITRGKPTWKNEEDGHKFDAYIPGTGDQPGYWFSPMSVFNETVNDIWRYKQGDKTFMDAVDRVQGNKESALFRAAMIAAAGTGQIKSTTSLGQLKQAGQQLAPVPITFGRLGQVAGHAIAPSVVPPAPPGALTKQTVSSLGLKLEAKLSDVQEVRNKAKEFAKAAGISKDTGYVQQETDEPNYSKLRTALRNGDENEAKRQLAALRKTRTDKQIFHAMKLAKERPFTGSKAGERAFIRSLDDRELAQYQRALEQQDKAYQQWTDFALKNL